MQRLILNQFRSLSTSDVYKPVGTVPGCDLHLSAAARRVFPYGVEVKCQESLNIWSALEQCESNAKDEGLEPALFFKRNRTSMYVVLKADRFLELAAAKEKPRDDET